MIVNPQDIRIQKIMGALRNLNLSEEQLGLIEAFFTGEAQEDSLEKLEFQDLSGTSRENARLFEALFYDFIRKGRKEEVRKLFAVIFAIGKSTCGTLFPIHMMSELAKQRDLFPPDKVVSFYAESVGGSQNLMITYPIESLKKLAGTPETILEAMNYHKGKYDNGMLILYAVYFLMKYPDAKPEKTENVAEAGVF